MIQLNQSGKKMIREENWNRLHSFLEECVEKGVFPGADFAMVTKDEVKTMVVGNKQLLPEVLPNEGNTIWDLASISKVLVTTTCVLKLMEEGLITLKTKVCDVIPEFKNKEVTVKDIITHSSGLPADINGYKAMTTEEMVEAVYNMELEYERGSKVVYSDVNFILLGMIVARLKGSLDGFAKRAMFEPLNMKDTCYCPSEEVYDRCAAYELIENRGGVIRGTVHDGKAHKFNGVSGHAGVFSTLEDMIHYVQMLFNDGVYDGKRFFSPVTIDLLKKCQTSSLNERRSIGWIISDGNYPMGDYFSEHTLYHTGFSGSSMVIDLDRKVAFICLNNRVHPTRENKLILTARNNMHNLAYQCLERE